MTLQRRRDVTPLQPISCQHASASEPVASKMAPGDLLHAPCAEAVSTDVASMWRKQWEWLSLLRSNGGVRRTTKMNDLRNMYIGNLNTSKRDSLFGSSKLGKNIKMPQNHYSWSNRKYIYNTTETHTVVFLIHGKFAMNTEVKPRPRCQESRTHGSGSDQNNNKITNHERIEIVYRI